MCQPRNQRPDPQFVQHKPGAYEASLVAALKHPAVVLLPLLGNDDSAPRKSTDMHPELRLHLRADTLARRNER